jgi:enterochelin esterase-like enzyme
MDPAPRTYIQRQAKRGGALVRRSELFEEMLIQLDSAAGEAEQTGPKSVAVMIQEVLIPFIEEEQATARRREGLRVVSGGGGGCIA